MKPSGRLILRSLQGHERIQEQELGSVFISSFLNSFRQRRDSVGSCFLLLHAFIGRCSWSGIGSCVEILTGPSIRYMYMLSEGTMCSICHNMGLNLCHLLRPPNRAEAGDPVSAQDLTRLQDINPPLDVAFVQT